jgi:HlyD family secretion protein
VDAYPNETFKGRVEQVRLQPTIVQNVTTYSTIISAPNAELKLKPGMTANVKVEIARRDNVTRVPNAALRFKPTAEMFAALNQEPEELGRGPHVWLFVNDALKPVAVHTDITDGSQTALAADDVQPGTEVVTGMSVATTSKPAATSGAGGNPLLGPQRRTR